MLMLGLQLTNMQTRRHCRSVSVSAYLSISAYTSDIQCWIDLCVCVSRAALRIQVSEQCKDLLDQLGVYEFDDRGQVEVKVGHSFIPGLYLPQLLD